MPSSLNMGLGGGSSLAPGIVPFSASSIMNNPSSSCYMRTPDLHSNTFHGMPQFNPFAPRPEELFYSGLRSNLPPSNPFRPEDNALGMMQQHNMSLSMSNTYHERLSLVYFHQRKNSSVINYYKSHKKKF